MREKKGKEKSEREGCRAFLWLGGQDREDLRVLLERGEKQRRFRGFDRESRGEKQKRGYRER